MPDDKPITAEELEGFVAKFNSWCETLDPEDWEYVEHNSHAKQYARAAARIRELEDELKILREIAEESRVYVEELMPNLGDHVCGHPDSMCDTECQDAMRTQQL